MNKQLFIGAVVALSLTLSACGGKNDPAASTGPQASAPAASVTPAADGDAGKDAGKVEVDKGLFHNEITIPASMLEGQDLDAVIAKAKEDGVKEATKNEDGSVTYKMTKDVYGKMIGSMKDNLLEGIEELKSGKDFASVKDIEHNDSFTEYTLVVDKAAYEGSFDAFAALGVALPSMLYQVYSGTAADKTKVTVHIQDQASGEVFNTVVYPDAMKNG
ncbi:MULTISPECIES: hypothetical protein [Paenibacillus]|uniref:hypothetical protein n=1 Tax=Paenibacillus TaxID=44249 RepID=UPI00038FB7FD|nr:MULTISPECIES: hypothetical protein [Paenibacillus]KKC47712.1 hypothetical protein VE23_12320 [Paenibacillus sp. D9]